MRPRLVLAAAAVAALLGACGDPAPAPAGGAAPRGAGAAPASPPRQPLTARDVTTPPTVEWLTRGGGPALKAGDLVLMSYVGTFADGREFDRDEGFVFELGAGHVIRGWDLAVAMLRVGDKVRTTIRSDLAYGDRGVPPVVAGPKDLTYEIEVLGTVGAPTWEVLQSGDGPAVERGRKVTVLGIGALPDGTVYYDARRRGTPDVFTAGVGESIEGLDTVILKMRVGDRWKIRIPWAFAYGSEGRPPSIPPRTDLVYDVEVMRVE